MPLALGHTFQAKPLCPCYNYNNIPTYTPPGNKVAVGVHLVFRQIEIVWVLTVMVRYIVYTSTYLAFNALSTLNSYCASEQTII